MDEIKACKNCKYWERLAVDLLGDDDVDTCTKIKIYDDDPHEDYPRLAITEPDFYCAYFEPKTGEEND
jgi:hypothetical protein